MSSDDEEINGWEDRRKWREIPEDDPWPLKAYRNERFLRSRDARPMRILAEYLEPEARFDHFNVFDTVVFFGSSRIVSKEEAERRLEAVHGHGGDVAKAERDVFLSQFYEEARELAKRLTEWSKSLDQGKRRYIVCTGGGPGIMEAANRGASEASGINVGLGIALPHEQLNNRYITRALSFEFHYFFMRKLWFTYLAKALIVFPGGFGTMDELFETLTLVQTRKINKRFPIVLFGREYWDEVLNLDALVKYGTINAEDLELFRVVDSVDEAFDYITAELDPSAEHPPGGHL